MSRLGFRVWGLAVMFQGLGFGVWGLGFRVSGVGLRVQGADFRLQGCSGFRVQSSVLRAKGLGS